MTSQKRCLEEKVPLDFRYSFGLSKAVLKKLNVCGTSGFESLPQKSPADAGLLCDLAGIQTPNLLSRNQVLYSVKLQGQ